MIDILTGHDSRETAYVVDDYPYGFRLRCKIRYWLEYKPSKGYRFCSQTTNPKVSTEMWNAVKCSTYTHLAVMVLRPENDKGIREVHWDGVPYYDHEKWDAWIEEHAHGLQDTTRADIVKRMLAARAHYRLMKERQAAGTK